MTERFEFFDHTADIGAHIYGRTLAADLAARGQRVRLVIDDAAPLAHLAPHGAPGVQVLGWPGPAAPGDVVVEAFGCDPPEAAVAAGLPTVYSGAVNHIISGAIKLVVIMDNVFFYAHCRGKHFKSGAGLVTVADRFIPPQFLQI